jgi:hypothetical protein
LKGDVADVITLLASLKKIIVDRGQIFWDLACLHLLPIEEAADSGMLGRGKTITYKKCRDGIKAGIVEAIDTGIPPP